MRFVDIAVERFGVLDDVQLKDLSPGMTVVYGGNGSGKTTMVSFLRGLLFGYTTDHQGFQAGDQRFGGSVSLQSAGRSLRAARECSHGISSELSAVDLGTGVSVSSNSTRLPAWVNETVYQEVFSVGYQEAARFDLLTRLCLDGHGTVGSAEEIRRTESSIQQCIHEREGNGADRGLQGRRLDLERTRSELLARLAELRKQDPEIPARIARLESELARLNESLRQLDVQISGAQAEIHRLEELLAKLKRRNVVPLDRIVIEREIAELNQRKQRWSQIRTSIRQEVSGTEVTGTESSQSTDSLMPIRAIVSRLEERMDAFESHDMSPQSETFGVGRDVFLEHLRSEVFSLCDYVSRHESAVGAVDASLERLLGQTTLQNAERVEAALQGQIDVLQAELVRSDDVIEPSRKSIPACDSVSHANFNRRDNSGASRGQSAESVTEQLESQRRRLHTLNSERHALVEQIRRTESELSGLRLNLKPVGRLEDVDRVKAQIADIETQLGQLDERWRILETTESDLRTTLDRLRSQRDSDVMELASKYVSRLTDGDCYRLSGDRARSQILAETRQSVQPMGLQQLSRGTRDLVALALRLALIECRAETAERCPLILDDVFIAADDDGASAAADLLLEIAENGQQIIFFTCQNDVRDLFIGRRAEIRTLHEKPTVHTPTVFAPRKVFTPAPASTVVAEPQPVEPAVDSTDHTNWLFYLEVDNSVEDLSGLTVAEIEAFRASEIDTVDQLLTGSAEEVEERFRQSGYSISRDRIRAWRGQAQLATQVPMLRRSDAELLFAAGIQTALELSRMRPEGIYDLVTQFQTTQAGARFRRSGQLIDRQQSINWSRWSQHSRSLSEARRSRSRYFFDDVENARSDRDTGSDSDQTGSRSRRQLRITGNGRRSRRQPRPTMSADSREQRERRQSQRRNRMSRHSSSYRTRDSESTESEATEVTFYLNRSADVEKAPSIGPKTAQRLAKAKVFTVDDLLNADAEGVAAKLANKRINADTIAQWQHQARLICQVPGLRGHDAQILVACGVTEAEQLSAKRPADLYSIVGPFADTTEGERIVRNGRKPDLDEVTDWISWAQRSRSLKAAA